MFTCLSLKVKIEEFCALINAIRSLPHTNVSWFHTVLNIYFHCNKINYYNVNVVVVVVVQRNKQSCKYM